MRNESPWLDMRRWIVLPGYALFFLMVALPTVEELLYPKVVLLVFVFILIGIAGFLRTGFVLHPTIALWTLFLVAVGYFFVLRGFYMGAPGAADTLRVYVVWPLVLWWLIRWDGIEGAAIAWTARVFVDALILFILSRRLLPTQGPGFRKMGITIFAAVVTLVLAGMLPGFLPRIAFLVSALGVFAILAWHSILGPMERKLAQSPLKTTQFLLRGEERQIH